MKIERYKTMQLNGNIVTESIDTNRIKKYQENIKSLNPKTLKGKYVCFLTDMKIGQKN